MTSHSSSGQAGCTAAGRPAGRAGPARTDGRLAADVTPLGTLTRSASAPAETASGDRVLTSRNNSHPAWWTQYDTPLREPRPYVLKCGTGTLALLFEGSRVAFTALTCDSWNCPHCRRVKAAQLLDRMRRGMETRATWRRTLVTLTLNPADFGARQIGMKRWEDGRVTRLWSKPTAAQFDRATLAMSKEWDRLNKRLGRKADRAETIRPEFFRVIELHRNVWPHYHVVIEHPEWGANDIEQQVEGWDLGRVHLAEVGIDDAVGELAPYLVSTEAKGAGHKAYQFAARALPKGFRLYSASRGFLADPEPPQGPGPESWLALEGHFRSHHEAVKAWGGDARIVLNPPTAPAERHRPPSSSIATGDAALLYYLAHLDAQPVQISPEDAELYSVKFLHET